MDALKKPTRRTKFKTGVGAEFQDIAMMMDESFDRLISSKPEQKVLEQVVEAYQKKILENKEFINKVYEILNQQRRV